MKKHKVKKERHTVDSSVPSRQVIQPKRKGLKGLTVVHNITFQFVCEMEKVTSQVPIGGGDEWENWAALHPNSAL